MAVKISTLFFFSLCFKYGILQRTAGDSCAQHGYQGTCKNIRHCASAEVDPRDYKICGHEDNGGLIVCCLEGDQGQYQATTAPHSRPAIVKRAAEYVPEMVEYMDIGADAKGEGDGCAPLSSSQTAAKTGRKAWDKCIEYQEKLVYPCKRGVTFLGKRSRQNYCQHNADQLIVGGVTAETNEFPHMALLGFAELGESEHRATYECGGTVISDRFIVTAAHCTSNKLRQQVSFAKVALLRRSEQLPAARVHRIKRVIKYPSQLAAGVKYHDIALLETETQIILDEKTIPACVHTGDAVDDSRASVTGWGDSDRLATVTDTLQKVTLSKFSSAACADKYDGLRAFPDGFNETTQMCFGHHTESKDTCQGDSGGPLQINNQRIHCMYTVIGVTSSGKNCGEVDQPALYTRVAAYASWIESIVWP